MTFDISAQIKAEESTIVATVQQADRLEKTRLALQQRLVKEKNTLSPQEVEAINREIFFIERDMWGLENPDAARSYAPGL